MLFTVFRDQTNSRFHSRDIFRGIGRHPWKTHSSVKFHDFPWISTNLVLFTKIFYLPVVRNDILAYLLPNYSNQNVHPWCYQSSSTHLHVSYAEFIFIFVFLIVCWYQKCLTLDRTSEKRHMKFRKSVPEFSVKFSVFSNSLHENLCFPLWISLVPNRVTNSWQLRRGLQDEPVSVCTVLCVVWTTDCSEEVRCWYLYAITSSYLFRFSAFCCYRMW